MIRISSLRQGIRIAELLSESGEAHHFEIGNTLETEPETVHLKEFRIDGTVHNFYIDPEGDAPVVGNIGAWGIIPAQSEQS